MRMRSMCSPDCGAETAPPCATARINDGLSLTRRRSRVGLIVVGVVVRRPRRLLPAPGLRPAAPEVLLQRRLEPLVTDPLGLGALAHDRVPCTGSSLGFDGFENTPPQPSRLR